MSNETVGQVDSIKRYDVYKDPEVASFLAKLIEIGEEVKPEFDLDIGYRYVDVEKITGKGPVEARVFLRELARRGVLEKRFFDMSILCPSCDSANVSTNYVCPFCGSPRIVRNALVEHVSCGYIGNLMDFRVGNDLICPNCKVKVEKGDCRDAGNWYECLSCGRRIEAPCVIHICRKCGERFDFDNAKYVEVYSYLLSETVKAEIESGSLFFSLARTFFTDMKFKVEIPGKLIGNSGVEHRFDILLRDEDGSVIAIDTLFSKNPPTQVEIVGVYGKVIDTGCETYIVASSPLSEEAMKLAKAYNLNVVEGSPLETLEKLKKILSLRKTGGKKVKKPSLFKRLFKPS